MKITKMTDLYDVVVCGGGPAGIGAAVAAARNGQKTLLLEQNGFMGGTSTAGALPMILGHSSGSIPFPKMLEQNLKYSELPRPRNVVGGVFKTFMDYVLDEKGSLGVQKVAQTDRYPGLDRFGCHDEFVFDLETGKRALDRLMLDCGVTIRYFAKVIEVKRNDFLVEGVYFADKSGINYCPAKTVIDCTGDADVVFQAGFDTVRGDRESGAMAIAGLVAHVEGIDCEAVERYLNEGNDPWFRPLCEKARGDHPELNLPKRIIMFPMMPDGVFMINGGLSWGGYDGTDGESITALMIRGRQEAEKLVSILMRGYFPGCQQAKLRLTASYPGVRETRRIVSEGPLTEAVLLSGGWYEDTIALGGRHFDLQRDVANQPFASKGLSVKRGVTPIPYSSLIPKNSKNLLAAGRCIDAEGQALGPARIMSTCMAVGEAAGTAAALANKGGCSFVELNVKELQATLRNQGAEIDA